MSEGACLQPFGIRSNAGDERDHGQRDVNHVREVIVDVPAGHNSAVQKHLLVAAGRLLHRLDRQGQRPGEPFHVEHIRIIALARSPLLPRLNLGSLVRGKRLGALLCSAAGSVGICLQVFSGLYNDSRAGVCSRRSDGRQGEAQPQEKHSLPIVCWVSDCALLIPEVQGLAIKATSTPRQCKAGML